MGIDRGYAVSPVADQLTVTPQAAPAAGLSWLRWNVARLRRADAIALAALILLPVLAFGLPALSGHLVVPGDDLTQNYPLRVLVGRQLATGHLPLLDPYIWSGAPLLGDWNAGAAYPLTLLFAIMPGAAAWTLNLIVTWAVAGAAMFCFLRALRLGTLPSFLGALAFAFAGAMPAQIGHFGLVAGMSLVPVQLLAVLRLSAPRGRASRLRWIAVLAVAFGLTILAGEPRAIDNAAVLVGLYALWQSVRAGRNRGPLVLSVAAGVALGACLGAVQLLPGLAAVSTSQRAASSLALYNSGSLPPQWLLLMLIPDLLGGSGSFGQPAFFASYNLAEVTGYMGILPLVAALAMLGKLRLHRPLPEWVVWHVVAAVGIVLALGGHTPAGHLLAHVPLFGSQRLQSRNLLVVGTGLAVLLAYWAEDLLRAKQRIAAQPGERRRWRPDLSTALGLLPPVAVLIVAAIGIWSARSLLGWLGVSRATLDEVGSLTPSVAPFALLAAVAIGLLLIAGRLPRRQRRRLVAAFVVADVIVFTLLAVVQVLPAAHHSPAPSTAGEVVRERTAMRPVASPLTPIGQLGFRGRFAVYDPGLIDPGALARLEPTDLNVMSAVPSVQGYSSIVGGQYAEATGSHRELGNGQDVLSTGAIQDGVLGRLDTSVLVTLPRYLITSGTGSATSPRARAPGGRQLTAGRTATWYLGTLVSVSAVSVPDAAARRDAADGLQIGLVAPDGRIQWLAASAASSTSLEVRPRLAAPAVAVVSRSTGPRVDLGPPAVTESGGATVVADGVLQDALTAPQWAFARFDGPFAVFADRRTHGALSLAGLPGSSAAGAFVRAVTGPAAEPVSAAVSSPAGVQLVRAVADIPGWTATWHPADGPARPLRVRRAGLVQAVDLPSGTGVVTWAYEPPGFAAGLGLSVAAMLIIVALAGGQGALERSRSVVSRRRRGGR